MGIDFQFGIIIFILVVSYFLSATGDSNFSMERSCLTVGWFSQPSVARMLIEQNETAEW